jgi:SAM-dependent methyltransferase
MMAGFYDPLAYDLRTEGVPGDVDFFVELARDAHSQDLPVLELACGTGRVAIPIAQEGVRVYGLDASPAMLRRAREKSSGLSNARWIDGDMRSFQIEERFGLVYIPFRSFQHILTMDGQLSCLRCIYDHLTPGGRFALDIFNPDIVAMATWMTSKRGGLQGRGPRHNVVGWESRAYHPAIQQVETIFIDETVSDEGAVLSRTYRDLTLRYTFRYEMQHLLERTGFQIEALFGDCFGSAFEDNSPEQIWVARRPD